MSRLRTLRDMVEFVREEKRMLLAPLIVVILLLTAFILLAEIPVLTPFIYALF